MPFLMVHGVPPETPSTVLFALRRKLVRTIVKEMNVPAQWVRIFFVPDMLGQPEVEQDGSRTVYVRLDTAMFNGVDSEAQDERANAVISAVAQMIWAALNKRYEVEVFVGELSSKWKILLLPED
jgi:hypothetical protein